MFVANKFCAFYLKLNVILNALLLFVCIKLFVDKSRLSWELDNYQCISEKPDKTDPKPRVKVFDLRRALEPKRIYEHIDCRESARFHTSVTLCTHEFKNDVHVSGSILRSGVWERHIISEYKKILILILFDFIFFYFILLFINSQGKFTTFLERHPGCLVIDVGAQIGQYTLFAAKLGSDVISVEPFYENLIRLHKAVKLDRLESRIILIANAISNERNQVKLLQRVESNIGGQSLLENNHKFFVNRTESEMRENAYLVETILFDDLLEYLPKNASPHRRKAIMKIDIEGFEPYAFQHAKNLFKTLDFQVIFMEMGVMSRDADHYGLKRLILQMINFLYAHELVPCVYDEAGDKKELKRDEWLKWPWDIFWEKKGLRDEDDAR